MAVLKQLGAAALATVGCYGPELRDCAVACASDLECAPEQVCGRDGRCASPALAGRCTGPDAGPGDAPPPRDAGSDAFVPPLDAPAPATLRIKIRGRGHVLVGGNLAMTCDHEAPGDQCMFEVTAGVPIVLHAFPAFGHRFERWKEACDGEQPTCTVTPSAPKTTVEAEFENHDDD